MSQLPKYLTCPKCGGRKAEKGKQCAKCRWGGRTTAERMWGKVAIGEENECWPWTGGVTEDGYGRLHSSEEKRNVMAHRVAYEFATKSTIPDGMQVCHTCDNPPCCNPKHFFLGTNQENQQDASKKGRFNRKGEKAGNAALNDIAVASIRKAYTKLLRDAAEKYGVSVYTIRNIVRQRNWNHIKALNW